MNKLYILLLSIGMACSVSCSQQNINVLKAQKDISVLFVGNSLIYTNDLPNLVKESAKEKGIKMKTEMIAFPNYAIADHWIDGQVQKLIANNNYDFMIIQQGPSSQNEGRQMLIEYGKKYSDICIRHDAKLCYLMVWPSLNYYHSFDKVIQNYSDAASINKAMLLPAGKAWKEYFDSSQDFDYYGPDGFHPSPKGSQVVADIILEKLIHEINQSAGL